MNRGIIKAGRIFLTCSGYLPCKRDIFIFVAGNFNSKLIQIVNYLPRIGFPKVGHFPLELQAIGTQIPAKIYEFYSTAP